MRICYIGNFSLRRICNNTKGFFSLYVFITILHLALYTDLFSVFNVIKLDNISDHLIHNVYGSTKDVCPAMRVYNISLWYPDNNVSDKTLENIAIKYNIKRGGRWKPPSCNSGHLVAILVPFRDRHPHLKTFLSFIHPFLQHQNIEYQIFVIEQSEKNEFNRGKLFNVGYLEALKKSSFSCFIFHDVDLIPQNVNNIYACTKYPRHMSSSVNKYRYSIPYDLYFGGVVSMLSFQFKQVNGFSNLFYGWGGEDDDFFNRVKYAGFEVCRFEHSISRYYALSHKITKPSNTRYKLLYEGPKHFQSDGVNNVTYSVVQIRHYPLYTKLLVDV